MDSAQKVLLVEDDPEIGRQVAALVRSDLSLPFEMATDGENGLTLALRPEFSLVLIDANLPLKSGFDICRELRQKRPEVGIIFLTGRADEVDKVVGLELGADDYVTKPFGAKELAARIRSVLRRLSGPALASGEEPVISVGDLRIDTRSRRVFKSDTPVHLTLVEFELLLLLASHPGTTFDRGDLLELVLGYSTDVHNDALTVHLSRLRAKIETNPAKPVYILTVRGVGYRFAAADEIPTGE